MAGKAPGKFVDRLRQPQHGGNPGFKRVQNARPKGIFSDNHRLAPALGQCETEAKRRTTPAHGLFQMPLTDPLGNRLRIAAMETQEVIGPEIGRQGELEAVAEHHSDLIPGLP
jgi:hypothetical protein